VTKVLDVILGKQGTTMGTFYEICIIVAGGLAVAFVALLALNRMGCVALDPVHVAQNIVYSIRH
jgi:hypothetical protein